MNELEKDVGGRRRGYFRRDGVGPEREASDGPSRPKHRADPGGLGDGQNGGWEGCVRSDWPRSGKQVSRLVMIGSADRSLPSVALGAVECCWVGEQKAYRVAVWLKIES